VAPPQRLQMTAATPTESLVMRALLPPWLARLRRRYTAACSAAMPGWIPA
jgi:hypothetical protein